MSPHLDDAAFSVGGTLAALADGGHDVQVVTCFTRSVAGPTGFALACQLDKGLDADVDYLALRRAEDRRAMEVLAVRSSLLDLPEAPHRGYESAPELFVGVRPGDDVWQEVLNGLDALDADLWLAPQGLGNHVDHLQVVRAVRALDRPTAWWRDAPYVLREPGATPSPLLPSGLVERVPPQLATRRVRACSCYASQVGFQFGGDAAMRTVMTDHVERLLTPVMDWPGDDGRSG